MPVDAKQLLILGITIMAILNAPSFTQDSKEPYVRVAEIEIDPAQLDAYKIAAKEQVEAAVRLEPGVLALYCVSDKDNPAHVFVFEIYADVNAYNAHLDTAHFRKYKIGTQDMVKSLKLRDTVPIQLGAKPR
jgi:quinol monooxygenase YgiN